MKEITLSKCIDHGKSVSLRPEGYALVGIKGKRSRCTGLHRLVYCEHNNLTLQDIEGKVVRHKCDNPRCINPKHLLLGTRADNNRDRAERGRSAKTVPSRQSLTDEQVAEIRREYVKGSQVYGAPALGRKYGVHQSYINRIVKGVERENIHI